MELVSVMVFADSSVILKLLACVVVSYLLGNISPAILIGRAYGVNIKKEGSGNAGTTNVLRVLGKKAAAMTLVIDIGKGVLAVLIGRFTGNLAGAGMSLDFAMACAIAVFLGHIFPVFFKFKGGKGVATAFGALVTLNPALGFSALAIVLVVVIITRRVSAGSVCGAFCAPFLAYVFVPEITGGIIVMAAIVIFKHRGNIKRLIKGEEPKLSFKK